MAPQTSLAPRQVSELATLCWQLAAGVPLSRLVGRVSFEGHAFGIRPGVFEPRPESELLLETAREILAHKPPRWILDLGTGSGCLGLAALRHWPQASGVLTDISALALAQARENAQRMKLETRCSFLRANWTSSLAPIAQFDLILTNPPYVKTSEPLPRVVGQYDPPLALDGGADGLQAYRMLIRDLFGLLAPHGIAVLEHGAFQKNDIQTLLTERARPTQALEHAPEPREPREPRELRPGTESEPRFGPKAGLSDKKTLYAPPWSLLQSRIDFAGKNRVLLVQKKPF